MNKLDEAKNYALDHLKTVTHYQMAYSDLDELVNLYFGVEDFDFVASGERSNDSSYIFRVSKSDVSIYELADEWWFEYNAADIALAHLCADGVIPEGEYLIDLCW